MAEVRMLRRFASACFSPRGTLGWLSPPEQRAELLRMIADRLERTSIGSAEVELV